MRIRILAWLLAAISVEASAGLVIVTSDADTDDGACDAHCTLREAIHVTNTTADFETLIDFDIPGGGTRTIVLTTPLPTVSKSIQVFGFSQPGASAGNGGFSHVIRLQIDGSLLPDAGSVVGLDMNVPGQFGSVRVEGIAFGGFMRPQGGGVALRLRDGKAQITSNHFGLAADGGTVTANDVGIDIQTADGATVDGNVVSGNGTGIIGTGRKDIGQPPLRLNGNRIGTDKAGGAVRANGGDGVRIVSSCAAPTQAFEFSNNVISGNGRDGIHLEGPDDCNLVVGLGWITGNRIGTAANGTTALGNARHGIFAGMLASTDSLVIGSQIGSSAVQDRNTLGFNGGAGVRVPEGAGGVLVRENTFRANLGLPIDIGNDGPTPNDAGDADTGGNRRLNSPILGSLRTVPSGLEVSVTVEGATSALTYPVRVDLYARDGANAMTFVKTDFIEAPNAPKNVGLALPGGTELVAMASDNANGALTHTPSNSSEFSAAALRAVFSDGFE